MNIQSKQQLLAVIVELETEEISQVATEAATKVDDGIGKPREGHETWELPPYQRRVQRIGNALES